MRRPVSAFAPALPDLTSHWLREALKRTLLKAKLVTFNSTGATAGLVNKLFERLAIVDAMKPKIISGPVSGGAQKQVAEGKADLVLILIPEVTQEAGVEYLGPLPGDLQSYINFTGGVSVNSHDPEKAKAALRYIASPAAAATIKAKGLEAALSGMQKVPDLALRRPQAHLSDHRRSGQALENARRTSPVVRQSRAWGCGVNHRVGHCQSAVRADSRCQQSQPLVDRHHTGPQCGR